LRVQRADALEKILESLDTQLVPPDFHQGSADSSLFGSQLSGDENGGKGPGKPSTSPSQHSPSATLLGTHPHANADRSKWKSLRDFVDERAIDDVLETMESGKSTLDVRRLDLSQIYV
jgi:autophagy-related protein 17